MQAHALTRQSLQQYERGNHAGAATSLRSAQLVMQTHPGAFTASEKQHLAALLIRLHEPIQHGEGRPAVHTEQLAGYRQAIVSLDPFKTLVHQEAPPRREPSAARKALEAAWRAVPQPMVVKANVLQFGNDFRHGATTATDSLFQEKYRLHPTDASCRALSFKFSAANARLIDAWLSTPKDKRVFVVGSGADVDDVQAWSARHPDLQFFFYRHCRPLCQESTVGAFFGTSGHVLHIDTPAARNSIFVPVENRVIQQLAGGRRVVLIDGDAARHLMAGGASATAAATLLTCAVSAATDNVQRCP